jgi:hypothetical protein
MTPRSRELETPVALLTRCDPFASAPISTPEVEDALAEIAQAIMRESRQLRPRRRMFAPPLRVALVVAAVGVLIGGVATAAVALHAHTGLFSSKAEVPMGGPSEQLNPAAPDFNAVAQKLAADIPYPAGYESWREWVLTVQAPKSDVGSGARYVPRRARHDRSPARLVRRERLLRLGAELASGEHCRRCECDCAGSADDRPGAALAGGHR